MTCRKLVMFAATTYFTTILKNLGIHTYIIYMKKNSLGRMDCSSPPFKRSMMADYSNENKKK